MEYKLHIKEYYSKLIIWGENGEYWNDLVLPGIGGTDEVSNICH